MTTTAAATSGTASGAAGKPTFADESAIRGHYQRMLDAREHGAEAYAECFAPDATYIIANGKVQRGWQEIVDGHQIIFSAWARNSRLEGRIDRLTFLTADVAQLVAYGHTVYKDRRSSRRALGPPTCRDVRTGCGLSAD
jgi:uncharacterized protein (TIGR02246 family)